MGKTKYASDIKVLFKKSPLVSYSSLERIVQHKKKIKGYTKLIVYHLLKKGAIQRITKGYYTNTDDITLAVLCFQPAYFGLQDALSFHGIWEQETIPIIITTKNVRTGIRSCMDSNILLRKIDKKYFFGITYQHHDNVAIPYSDIEKTFIDMIFFKENMSKEVLANFKEKINKNKLKHYLKKYPKGIRKKIEGIF